MAATLLSRTSTVLAAAGLAVLLTACGESQVTNDTASGASSLAETADDPAIQRDFARWFGSQAQRAAAEVVVAHMLNGGTAECMRDSGQDWDWSTGVMPASQVDALAVTTWFAEARGTSYTDNVRLWAPFHRAQNHMNADGTLSEAADRAMTRCLATVTPAGDDAVEKVRSPALARSLGDSWVDAVRAAAEKYGSDESYADCMTQAQIPLLHDQPYTPDLLAANLIDIEPSLVDIPAPGEDAGKEWSRFVELDLQVSQADDVCRHATYAQGLPELRAVAGEFAAEHADGIEKTAAFWAGIEDEARALGWDGQVAGGSIRDNAGR